MIFLPPLTEEAAELTRTNECGTTIRAYLRHGGARTPTGILHRRHGTGGCPVKRFAALEVALCRFFDLGDLIDEEAATGGREAENDFGDCCRDIRFLGHWFPFGQTSLTD